MVATVWLKRALGGIRRRQRTNAVVARANDYLKASTSVLRFTGDEERLTRELDRARRYEHPLAVIVLTVTPEGGGGTNGTNGTKGTNGDATADDLAPVVLETTLPHLVSLLAGATLCEVLRGTDTLYYQAAQDRFVIGLAESGRDEARRALHRVRAIVRSHLRLSAHGGIARFPDDGLTLDGLIAKAEEDWRGEVPAEHRPDNLPNLDWRYPRLRTEAQT
jgi:hypothetical protein